MMIFRPFLLSLAAFALFAAGAWAQDTRVIEVMGEGRVSLPPDMATVSLGVRREARDASAAMSAASAAAAAVLATLGEAGIAPEDIQTTRIGLDPRYQHSNDGAPPRITGYIASNDLSVRVRDLDTLGAVLDRLVEEGANSFQGLGFGLSEPGVAEAEARAAAVSDAIARAETLADAAGLALGQVLTISETAQGRGPVPFARSAMVESAAVPVAEGEVDVRVSVTVTFAIRN